MGFVSLANSQSQYFSVIVFFFFFFSPSVASSPSFGSSSSTSTVLDFSCHVYMGNETNWE
jgi:hypothetical protein